MRPRFRDHCVDLIALPPLPEGGYGVSVEGSHTAVEVLADPVSRLRYGFVASYPPGRDIEPVLRWFRRLHLTGAQFYDWAYRHADLISPTPDYADPLGQPISVDTVRRLASGLAGIGTAPIGYAAVYGVGNDEWPAWEHAALLAPDGTPYRLADFLSLVDPSDPGWLSHFTADLARAVQSFGFFGFHLDQYGYPRRAVRPDGRVVDVTPAFDTLIRAVRARLPETRLIFNNVNELPVWTTTSSPQDVTYTEFWQPHDRLADLAAAATRMRALAPRRPAVAAGRRCCSPWPYPGRSTFTRVRNWACPKCSTCPTGRDRTRYGCVATVPSTDAMAAACPCRGHGAVRASDSRCLATDRRLGCRSRSGSAGTRCRINGSTPPRP